MYSSRFNTDQIEVFMNSMLTLQCLIHTTGSTPAFLGSATAPRSPHLVRGRQPLIRHSFLTVNNSPMTVLQTLVTERQPPLTSTQLR